MAPKQALLVHLEVPMGTPSLVEGPKMGARDNSHPDIKDSFQTMSSDMLLLISA